MVLHGTVETGGDHYVLASSTLGDTPSEHMPFLLIPTVGGFEVRLEDLAATPALSDWDYNDAAWGATVTDSPAPQNASDANENLAPIANDEKKEDTKPPEGQPGNPKKGEPIKIDPSKNPIYRGGKSILPKPGDVQIEGETNSQKTKRADKGVYPADTDTIVPKGSTGSPVGPSTNLDPNNEHVKKEGDANGGVHKLPEGLEALNDKDGHVTIAPTKKMTYKDRCYAVTQFCTLLRPLEFRPAL